MADLQVRLETSNSFISKHCAIILRPHPVSMNYSVYFLTIQLRSILVRFISRKLSVFMALWPVLVSVFWFLLSCPMRSMRHLLDINLVSSKLAEPSVFVTFHLSIILGFPTLIILLFGIEDTFVFGGKGKMSTVSKRNVWLIPLLLTHWPLALAA